MQPGFLAQTCAILTAFFAGFLGDRYLVLQTATVPITSCHCHCDTGSDHCDGPRPTAAPLPSAPPSGGPHWISHLFDIFCVASGVAGRVALLILVAGSHLARFFAWVTKLVFRAEAQTLPPAIAETAEWPSAEPSPSLPRTGPATPSSLRRGAVSHGSHAGRR